MLNDHPPTADRPRRAAEPGQGHEPAGGRPWGRARRRRLARLGAFWLTAALASAPALSGCGQATQPAQPRDDGSQVVQSAPVGPADEAGAATEADPAPEDPAEADPDQADPDQAGGDPGDGGAGGDPAASFDILGKWKVVGGSGYGQAQANAIVQFAPESVNLFSPQDTWAVYEEGGALKLTVTGLLGGGSTFVVTVTDDDNIELATGGANVVLRRVG